MTVKEIAHDAAELLQEDDMLYYLGNSYEGLPSEDDFPEIFTLIRCVRSALAEAYNEFPVLKSKTVAAKGRRILFSALSNKACVVRRAERDGRAIAFSTDTDGIRVPFDGEYTVYYSEAYAEGEVTSEVALSAWAGKELLAYLSARNYCLVTGRTDAASIWDQMYLQELHAKRILKRAHMPARKFL